MKAKLLKLITSATDVKYIKLGQGDSWAKECIENNYVAFGYHQVANDFQKQYTLKAIENEILLKYYSGKTITKGFRGAISNHARQVNDFLNSTSKTIWITFYKQEMYWSLFDSSKGLFDFNDMNQNLPSRKRNLITKKWFNTSLDGKHVFNIDKMRGDLTKTRGYRGTVCSVEDIGYVKKIILNKKSQAEVDAENAHNTLIGHIKALITGLSADDFEVFIDLICSRAGLRRTGVVGKNQKHIDMQYDSILEEGFITVQVKSELSDSLIKALISDFSGSKSSRYIIAHHGSNEYFDNDIYNFCNELGFGDLSAGIVVWNKKQLAEYAINYGLYEWLRMRFL